MLRNKCTNVDVSSSKYLFRLSKTDYEISGPRQRHQIIYRTVDYILIFAKYMWRSLFCSELESLMLQVATVKIERVNKKQTR